MAITPLSPVSEQQPYAKIKPTHVRWNVVAMLAIITGLTYIDRLNLQVAGKYIQDEYKFDTQTMGWVLGAFGLGYAIFHVPGGWLGDRFGARRILALTVLWSSLFTALTAVAPSLAVGWLSMAWSFVILRFLLGAGEAAAFPLCNKTTGYWLGQNERAFGTSLFLTGVGVSGTIAPVLINWIARRWGWRMSFVICGVLGVIIAAVWYAYVRNRPEEHPKVNAAELALILGPAEKKANPGAVKKVRISSAAWRKILKSRSVRALMFSHFFLVYAVNIFFSWFFIYLVRVRGLAASRASMWISVPFLASILMIPFWGWIADRGSEKFGKRLGRQYTVWVGVGLSAFFLAMGAHTANNTLAALQLAAAAAFNLAASAILWTACSDITRDFAGSVSGAMTTFGSLGGWISPVVTAKIATSFGWPYALDFAALMTVVGGLAWFIIDVSQSVE
jgi:ACS family glucarate transporter-like MFS transporter